MALPVLVENDEQVKTGPGWFLLAPLTAATPTWAVTGGKFTNPAPGWYSGGFTDGGIKINFGTTSLEPVKVDQRITPLRMIPTDKDLVTVEVNTAGFNQTIFQFAMNGGTWTDTGTGATGYSKYTPNTDPSLETRCKFMWISSDQDEIFIGYRAYQSGSVSRTFGTGATKSGLEGMQWTLEIPSGGVPWEHLVADDVFDGPAVYA